jgi:hypothetical protein
VPGWHEALREATSAGRIEILGVTQEQHADRCQLFAQWKQLDWPILGDPINVLQSRAVPIVVAVDEYGVTRKVGPTAEWIRETFLDASDTVPADVRVPGRIVRPDVDELKQQALRSESAEAWRDLGDAVVLWGEPNQLDQAIAAYAKALTLNPSDAVTHFRLGVAHRMRYDLASLRHSEDFQAAVDAWSEALDIVPNQYIYRRRIQQYGPRLAKPYSFYDWVQQARDDLVSRGERPVELVVEPSGAEFASPARQFVEQAGGREVLAPDPDGRISRDFSGLIEIETTIVPKRVEAGRSARIHIVLRPTNLACWNNEVEPTRVWIEPPNGWNVDRRLVALSMPSDVESQEERRCEFEIQAPHADVTATRQTLTRVRIRAYALYYVCANASGTCLFLRQDIDVGEIRVGGRAD